MKCVLDVYGNAVPIDLNVTKYPTGGRIAISAQCGDGDYDRWGVLTVNIPEATVGDGEILVKTWSENETWVPQLLQLLPNHFKDTGRKVQAGYAEASIWEFYPEGKQA